MNYHSLLIAIDRLELLEQEPSNQVVEEVLSTLSPRERQVLQLRFDENPMTLAQVGRIFGVTKERVRQIEDKALRRLRHPSCLRKLRDYLDS